MRSLIFILSLFLLGCVDRHYINETKPMVVTNISYYNGECIYTIKTKDDSQYYRELFLKGMCKQYQVGDTIKFVTK